MHDDLNNYLKNQERMNYLEFRLNSLGFGSDEDRTELADLKEKQKNILMFIDLFDEPYRLTLLGKYTKGETFEAISYGSNYSYSFIRQLHPVVMQTIKAYDEYIQLMKGSV